MGLFTPVWMTEKWSKKEKAIAAVQKIRDQEKLFTVATAAPLEEVRIAAIRRLTDQDRLFRIASVHRPVCDDDVAAAEMISDPEKLFMLALTAADEKARLTAIKKITDPDVLYRLAEMKDLSGSEERAAVMRGVRSQERLLKIALDSRRPGNAKTAASYVKNPDCAFRLAMADTPNARYGVSSISDPEKMKQVVLNAPSKDARKAAVSKLEDPDLLIRALQEDTDPEVREKAASRIGWIVDRGTVTLTEAQYRELLNLSIYGSEYLSVSLFEHSPEDLRRISRASVREDNRAPAFRWYVKSAPAEELPALLREAEANRRKAGSHELSLSWDESKRAIVRRMQETDDPAVLLSFIKARDLGYGESFLRSLFADGLNGREGIEAIRDEAVAAYLSDVPSGRKEGGAYFWSLVRAIPPASYEKYGLKVSKYEREDEDQYGRNTVTVTEVEWQGKEYSFP